MEGAREQITPDDWGNRYAQARETYAACAAKYEELLQELIAPAGISTESITARAKQVASFTEKVRDKGQQYENPMEEMPDLVGARVVTYFVGDLAGTQQIIEQNFLIDPDRSSVGLLSAEPDRFGYVADHYEVKITPERAAMPEWNPYADIWVEIQVRTVLQDAWAAISHKLQYKAAHEVPRALRRQLFRMSALLETADKEFFELSALTRQLDTQYATSVRAGDLDVELNADSLAAFLMTTKRHACVAWDGDCRASGPWSWGLSP